MKHASQRRGLLRRCGKRLPLDRVRAGVYTPRDVRLKEVARGANMSVGRLILALSLCSAVVALQLWQTAAEADDWPLSSYPMYSWGQPAVASKFRIYGVTAKGEVELGNEHTRPLNGARLRAVLSRGADKAAKSLVPALCRNLVTLGQGPFSALRVYRHDWKINAQLKGFRGRGRMIASVPVLCPESRQLLEAQAKGEAPPPAPVHAPGKSVLLEAENARMNGAWSVVEDAYASGGRAVSIQGKHDTQSPQATEDTLMFEFEAPAGKYFVWLRGKTQSGTKGSVWLQVNEQIGTEKSVRDSGLGHFDRGFPEGVFVWSSNPLGQKPAQLRFERTGTQQLLIAPKSGQVVIDEVLITDRWREHPLHNAPVTP